MQVPAWSKSLRIMSGTTARADIQHNKKKHRSMGVTFFFITEPPPPPPLLNVCNAPRERCVMDFAVKPYRSSNFEGDCREAWTLSSRERVFNTSWAKLESAGAITKLRVQLWSQRLLTDDLQ